jgi:hypothetical protein
VRIVETYVLPDESKDSLPADFYGQEMDLVLCIYVRPERKFPNIHELISQIQSDVCSVKDVLADLESSTTSSLSETAKAILVSSGSSSGGGGGGDGSSLSSESPSAPIFEVMDYAVAP